MSHTWGRKKKPPPVVSVKFCVPSERDEDYCYSLALDLKLLSRSFITLQSKSGMEPEFGKVRYLTRPKVTK